MGEARAASAQRLGTEQQREFPEVITAAAAKSLAHQIDAARAWAMRDQLHRQAASAFSRPAAGIRIGLDGVVGEWTVAECTIDGFVMIAELRPSWKPAVSMVADAGRVVADKDAPIADVQLALVEVPGLIGGRGDLVADGAAGGVQCVQQLEKLRCSNHCRDAKFFCRRRPGRRSWAIRRHCWAPQVPVRLISSTALTCT